MGEGAKQDALEYVTSFERAFLPQVRPCIGDWIERWHDEATRFEVACSLLEAAAELSDYDLAWLKRQIDDPRVPWQDRSLAGLLRTVYADQAAKRLKPSWQDYSVFCLAPESLRLATPIDRCYLGQSLGDRYRLTRRLGSGGLGVVYEATDLVERRPVAIKAPVRKRDGDRYDAALRKEAGVLETLDIEGVPRFLGLFETETGPILVTELVEGMPLANFKGISCERSLRIASQAATILDRLHQQGHIHGDIKPENLLVDDRDKVTLIDFNVARPDDPRVTPDQFPGGTLSYMGPEAVLGVGSDVDLRQDIFGLGALLYQLVVGTPLMEPENREEAVVMSVLLGGKHEPDYPEKTPAGVQRICSVAISRHPRHRFETAGDFAASCSRLLADPESYERIPPHRSGLTAWRLGVALGTLGVRQRWITKALSADSLDETAFREEVTPYFIGVTTAMDEATPLAHMLDIAVEEWEGADEYRTLFYRPKRRQSEPIDRLKKLAEQAETWLRDTLKRVEKQLVESQPIAAALYLAALQSRFAPYSAVSARMWPEVAAPARFPNAIVERFERACTAWETVQDWRAELQGLDYSVIRWLRWDAPQS